MLPAIAGLRRLRCFDPIGVGKAAFLLIPLASPLETIEQVRHLPPGTPISDGGGVRRSGVAERWALRADDYAVSLALHEVIKRPHRRVPHLS